MPKPKIKTHTNINPILQKISCVLMRYRTHIFGFRLLDMSSQGQNCSAVSI